MEEKREEGRYGWQPVVVAVLEKTDNGVVPAVVGWRCCTEESQQKGNKGKGKKNSEG